MLEMPNKLDSIWWEGNRINISSQGMMEYNGGVKFWDVDLLTTATVGGLLIRGLWSYQWWNILEKFAAALEINMDNVGLGGQRKLQIM